MILPLSRFCGQRCGVLEAGFGLVEFRISIFAQNHYAVAHERQHPRRRGRVAVMPAHAIRKQTDPAGL